MSLMTDKQGQNSTMLFSVLFICKFKTVLTAFSGCNTYEAGELSIMTT